jgi:hypothetical protein
MEQQAPLWRPFLMAAIGFALWVARQSPERLRERWWAVYPILAGILAGCALVAWGIQRARSRRWPWYVEMFVMIGLLFAATFGLWEVLPLLRGE